jgi:hypothetical protein
MSLICPLFLYCLAPPHFNSEGVHECVASQCEIDLPLCAVDLGPVVVHLRRIFVDPCPDLRKLDYTSMTPIHHYKWHTLQRVAITPSHPVGDVQTQRGSAASQRSCGQSGHPSEIEKP